MDKDLGAGLFDLMRRLRFLQRGLIAIVGAVALIVGWWYSPLSASSKAMKAELERKALGAHALSGGAPVTIYDTNGAAVSLATSTNTVAPIAASTATAYTNPALPVAQRPTTVATAPVGGNLTAATATSVYAGAAGICQVAVSNLSTTIAMTCGQTSAVAAAVGLWVPALATYTTSWGYGGAVFCFPASGTPAYSTQITACP